jgi:hypothetical protein
MGLNPAITSYLDYLRTLRADHWADVITYRDYADGEQTAQLTAKQKEIITGSTTKDPEFALNVCSTIISAEVDRLHVKSLGVTATADDMMTGEQASGQEALSDTLTKKAWRWWKQSRMDEGQINAFFSACRDADSYLIVESLVANGQHVRPRIVVNQAMDGDEGVEIVYKDNSPSTPLYAIKQWTMQRPAVDNARIGKVQRRNIYYPDRVEKYINENVSSSYSGALWTPYMGDGDTSLELIEDTNGKVYEAAVAWWTNTGAVGGTPLGIPVFHLRNNARGGSYGRSSIADIVPGLQDAINLSAVSLLAAAQLAGFKIAVVTGVDDTVGVLKLFPGSIIRLDAPDAAATQLTESDLRQLIEVKDSYIKDAATITSTPLSFFNITGQVAAEGTLKQQEAALLAKVQRNQVSFGNTIEDAVRMMLKLEVVYGNSLPLSIDAVDELDINCEWKPAETRNDREVLDLTVIRHKELGTPRNVAWSEAGYSQDEITAMERDTDTRRNTAMGQLTQMIATTEQQNDVEVQVQQQVQQRQPVASAETEDGRDNGSANATAN